MARTRAINCFSYTDLLREDSEKGFLKKAWPFYSKTKLLLSLFQKHHILLKMAEKNQAL